jgi:PAS domain S-box-containing protein
VTEPPADTEAEARRLAAVMEAALDGIVIMDHEGKVVDLNPAAEKVFGLKAADAIGQSMADLIIPPRYRVAHRAVHRYLTTGEAKVLGKRLELFGLRSDGSEFPIELTVARIGETPPLFAGYIRDISDRVAAVEALRRSRDELSLILQGIPDGITVQDGDGRLVYANDAAAANSGFDSAKAMLEAGGAEIVKRFRLWDEDGKPLSPQDLPGRRALQGQSGERVVAYRRADGQEGEQRWATVSATPVRDDDGGIRFAINVFRDITDQKRAEQWRRFLGEASEILASSLDYAVTLKAFAEKAVSSLADWCTIDIRQPDGNLRCVAAAHVDPAKFSLVQQMREKYPIAPGQKGSAEVLASGQPHLLADVSDQTLVEVARSPEHLRLLRELNVRSVMYVPLSSRGEVIGVITFVTGGGFARYQPGDLHVAEELSRRASISVDNARLYAETQESLRSREDLMAIVSHDLRNPLGVVLASSTLLLKSPLPTEKGERARRQVEAIQRAGHRMNRLIRDLLDFASIQGGRLTISQRPYDGVNLVGEVLEVLEALATQKSLRLQNLLAARQGRLDVLCDHDRMIQVFSNVVGNAIKFTPEGGTISISAEADAGMVVFTVADTGPGMSGEELENIFDRYWQAQRRNRDGIGLGLSIAKGIIDAHGGRIWAESEIGKGTTFYFTLPSAASA